MKSAYQFLNPVSIINELCDLTSLKFCFGGKNLDDRKRHCKEFQLRKQNEAHGWVLERLSSKRAETSKDPGYQAPRIVELNRPHRAPDLIQNMKASLILSWNEGCSQLWIRIRFKLHHKNTDAQALIQIN